MKANNKKSNPKLGDYVKRYKQNSIFAKNMIYTSFALIIPLIIILSVSFFSMRSSILKNIETTNSSNLTSSTTIIEKYFQEIRYTGIVLSDLKDTFNYIIKNTEDPQQSFSNLIEMFSLYRETDENINSIYIYSETKNSVLGSFSDKTTQSVDESRDWAKTLMAKNTDNISFEYHKKNNIYPYLISLYVPIHMNNGKVYGAVIIEIDIEKICGDIHHPEFTNFIIHDNENQIIYINDYNYIGKSLDDLPFNIDRYSEEYIDGVKYIYQSSTLKYTDWNAIMVTPISVYNDDLISLTQLLVWFIILAVFLTVVFSAIISVKTSEPIKDLMKIFNLNDTDEHIEKQKSGEVEFIANKIIGAINQNEKLETTLKHRIELFNNSQMIALQMQINPHFLYNTLDNIKWNSMALTGGQNDVSLSIEQLAKLLRFSLEIEPKFVRLEEEKKYIDIYFEIMKRRHQGKLSIFWRIEEECYKYKVPRLMLQPIIENSIQHGIAPKRRPGVILVEVFTEDDDLVFKVTDDGIGMSEQEVLLMNRRLAQSDIVYHKHIGMLNVAQRIRLLMGEPYGIHVKSQKGIGSEIIIKIKQTLYE